MSPVSTQTIAPVTVNDIFPCASKEKNTAVVSALPLGTSKLSVHTCNSREVLKKPKFKLFQTVNHTNVFWDPNVKSKGILGGQILGVSCQRRSNWSSC